jgi:hypothetical protein
MHLVRPDGHLALRTTTVDAGVTLRPAATGDRVGAS